MYSVRPLAHGPVTIRSIFQQFAILWRARHKQMKVICDRENSTYTNE